MCALKARVSLKDGDFLDGIPWNQIPRVLVRMCKTWFQIPYFLRLTALWNLQQSESTLLSKTCTTTFADKESVRKGKSANSSLALTYYRLFYHKAFCGQKLWMIVTSSRSFSRALRVAISRLITSRRSRILSLFSLTRSLH